MMQSRLGIHKSFCLSAYAATLLNVVEPVEIYEYNPSWKEEFRRIGLRLRNALGDVARRIDHIGSTSIEGLAAKPVIDIQISVRRLEPMTLYLPGMEALGYVWRSDNPERTKRYFREPPQERRTPHPRS